MRALAPVALAAPFVAGCFHPAPPPDVAAGARVRPVFALLARRGVRGPAARPRRRAAESDIVTFVYGDCDPPLEGGCSPPLQIQIMALCPHLAVVELPAPGNMRTIRGAPVGRADGAPVLLTSAVQIRAYHGEGGDPALARRALAALRSVNDVALVVDGDDPFELAPSAVLTGERSSA